MAWTVKKYVHSFGDMRGVVVDFTTDSAEANIPCPLKLIEGFAIGKKSFVTNVGWTIKQNVDSSGTAYAGIGCSGFTSGDTGFVILFGR
jgi:hypothetical protein